MELEIEILENSEHIRSAFMEKFLLTWPEFQVTHKDFIASLAENYHKTVDLKFYDRSLMWDRMRPEYPSVSFRAALDLLKSIDGDVLFMSEGALYPHARDLYYNGKEYKHFIAKTNTAALADLIEFEWFDEARLSMQDMYRNDYILPVDLYVFTPTMDKMIVFTHETTDWESELDDPMKAAESRVCIAYGFEQ